MDNFFYAHILDFKALHDADPTEEVSDLVAKMRALAKNDAIKSGTPDFYPGAENIDLVALRADYGTMDITADVFIEDIQTTEGYLDGVIARIGL